MKKLMQTVKDLMPRVKRLWTGPTEQKGFTLIELLVVVAILGILAAVVVPNVSKFVGAGSDQAAETETANIQAAVDTAIADLNMSGLTIVEVFPLAACGALLTDFSTSPGCDLTDGAITTLLYPDYLRIKEAGGGRSYSWDTTGLVSLNP